jgi:hypothetical protein
MIWIFEVFPHVNPISLSQYPFPKAAQAKKVLALILPAHFVKYCAAQPHISSLYRKPATGDPE